MGKYDDAMYRYLEDNDRFADLFNGALFHGEELLQGDMLESDSGRYVTAAEKPDGGPKTGNRFRDLKKRMKNGSWLAVTAIENQEYIDYAMPVRMMEYDCLEYVGQVHRIARDKAKKLKDEGLVPSGWNTRLSQENKLHPVYSMCLYHGTDEWNGPESLKDMMDFEDAPQGWKELFHDYGMTLFCANRIEDFSVFKTELRQLLEVIPCRKSKRKLVELFNREEYRHLDRDTAETIAFFTDNSKMLEMLEDHETEGEYDMCQALEELVADGEAKGEAKGRTVTLLSDIPI